MALSSPLSSSRSSTSTISQFCCRKTGGLEVRRLRLTSRYRSLAVGNVDRSETTFAFEGLDTTVEGVSYYCALVSSSLALELDS